MEERILLAVDDSAASVKATEYLARWTAGRAEDHVHVVHVLPPVGGRVPSSEMLREIPGEVEARSRAERERAKALLEETRDRLCAAGLDAAHVDIGQLDVKPGVSIAEGMLDVARDNGCGTIVVGRNSLPWYKEWLHAHPADELVRKAHDVTVWIVE